MAKTILIIFSILFPNVFHSNELYGENLLFSPPNGYKIGFTDSSNEIYTQEWIPNGETIKDWSRMMTVQVLYNYNTKSTLKNFVDRFIGIIVDFCDEGRGLEISSGEEYGYSYNYFMTICGKNPNTKKPEYTMIKVISGNDALYLIQKAWRYEPTNSQIQDWSKLVSKVFLCDSRNKNAPCPKI